MNFNKLLDEHRLYFESGVTKTLDFRLRALRRLYREIVRHKESILSALKTDLGKSESEAYMTEIGLVLKEISFMLKNLPQWSKPKSVKSALAQFPGNCHSIREPYGVVLIMSPWNYPFMLTLSPLVGAIAAGNCCVVKPAKDSKATSNIISKILGSTFPSNYISVVKGGREENQALLDQRFDYIFFTGSPTVGKIVMEKASKHLTPITLELGGKSPCIVDATANLNLAAKRIVFGKFLNSGQTCIAPDYILVQKEIKQDLIAYINYWVKKMFGSNPIENRDYPKIINLKHYNRLVKLMKNENAVIGGHGDCEKLKIAPTVLTNITCDSPIMQEEIFGPILPIIPFNKLSQAEEIIKSHGKPLALYLFTGNPRVERQILRNISFGGGCINDTVMQIATTHMSFGGVGQSGMGSYHGKKSFETFTHEKSILKQSTKLDIPLRYQPYSSFQATIIKNMLK